MRSAVNGLKQDLMLENGYPGLSVLNFRFLFKKVNEILRILNYPSFSSPYSIIPFIAQAIGLEIPMMGSGKSPYSIVSYFTKFGKDIFLEKGRGLTYQARRELVDELYNMIAPYLLKEQSDYIELLIHTKYKKQLSSFNEQELQGFRDMMFKKFDILDKFLLKLNFAGGHYAHLAHYGYAEDLHREQNFVKDFDGEQTKRWAENAYPVVLEMQIDGFDSKNKTISGWYILVANHTEELLRSKTLRQKKLVQAAKLSKILGAKFCGMAGLVASFTKGGNFLDREVEGIGFTTGHAFTIANIYDIAKSITQKVNLDLAKTKIAVVGAAGSIGSGVAKLMSENKLKEILLIDTPNMISVRKLEELKKNLLQINPDNEIKISKELVDVKESDMLIIATNASASFIKSEHLKSGAIIIDDSFPKNVARDIIKARDDVLLLEGGVSQLPKKQNGYVARNIPDLLDLSISKLISCKQAYGCLCETFILAALGHRGNYALGDADPKLAKDIMNKAKEMGFMTAVFQNYGFAVEESRIKRIQKIVSDRHSK